MLATSPRGTGVPVGGVNFGVAVAASCVAVGGKVGLGGIGVADGGGGVSVGGALVARGDGVSVGSASVGSGASVGGLSGVLPLTPNSRVLVPGLASTTISIPAANTAKRPIRRFRVLLGIVFLFE